MGPVVDADAVNDFIDPRLIYAEPHRGRPVGCSTKKNGASFCDPVLEAGPYMVSRVSTCRKDEGRDFVDDIETNLS